MAPASSVSGVNPAAVAENDSDEDRSRFPLSLRAAPLRFADRSSGVLAGRQDGVIGKMFVDSSVESEGTSVGIRKLQV